MISPTHFSKYLNPSNYKEIHTGGLFEADLRIAVVKHICPWCSHKLYLMSTKPLAYCRSKRCPIKVNTGKAFVIASAKLR